MATERKTINSYIPTIYPNFIWGIFTIAFIELQYLWKDAVTIHSILFHLAQSIFKITFVNWVVLAGTPIAQIFATSSKISQHLSCLWRP